MYPDERPVERSAPHITRSFDLPSGVVSELNFREQQVIAANTLNYNARPAFETLSGSNTNVQVNLFVWLRYLG
jgi:hypothetical protein